MGLRDVEAILGGPGEPTNDGLQLAPLAMPPLQQDFVAEALRWDHGGRQATVFLDDDRIVLGAIYIDRRPSGIVQELRLLLGV